MHVATNILQSAVVDGLVWIRKGFVDQRIVTVDRGVQGRMIGDEAVDGGLISGLDRSGSYLVCGPVFRTNDGGLAHGPAPSELFALRLRHVLALAAHVGFIHLDRASEQPDFTLKRLAQPVCQVPSGPLCHPEIPMQLHGRN